MNITKYVPELTYTESRSPFSSNGTEVLLHWDRQALFIEVTSTVNGKEKRTIHYGLKAAIVEVVYDMLRRGVRKKLVRELSLMLLDTTGEPEFRRLMKSTYFQLQVVETTPSYSFEVELTLITHDREIPMTTFEFMHPTKDFDKLYLEYTSHKHELELRTLPVFKNIRNAEIQCDLKGLQQAYVLPEWFAPVVADIHEKYKVGTHKLQNAGLLDTLSVQMVYNTRTNNLLLGTLENQEPRTITVPITYRTTNATEVAAQYIVGVYTSIWMNEAYVNHIYTPEKQTQIMDIVERYSVSFSLVIETTSEMLSVRDGYSDVMVKALSILKNRQATSEEKKFAVGVCVGSMLAQYLISRTTSNETLWDELKQYI